MTNKRGGVGGWGGYYTSWVFIKDLLVYGSYKFRITQQLIMNAEINIQITWNDEANGFSYWVS
jgi:hypothetical protein